MHAVCGSILCFEGPRRSVRSIPNTVQCTWSSDMLVMQQPALRNAQSNWQELPIHKAAQMGHLGKMVLSPRAKVCERRKVYRTHKAAEIDRFSRFTSRNFRQDIVAVVSSPLHCGLDLL